MNIYTVIFEGRKTKSEMKTFIFIIILFSLFTFKTEAQVGCDPLLNSSLPPSPYIDGYITFDGKGDFLRTDDLNQLEFPYNSTDSFTISAELKIAQPYKAMYIFGKYRSAGWIVGYNTNESGYLSIYINNSWKRIFQLGSDTSWHKYDIKYSKQGLTLQTYVDGALTNTYSDFTYNSMADNCAFSVGNVGFFAQYGPQSVNLSSLWFNGSIASLKINANANTIVNYGFNEGGGQIARDSLTYFYSDRSYPGSSTCGVSHLMLGFMPSVDSCDPEWSAFDNPVNSRFTALGSGTQYWYSNNGMEYYAEHFSTAMTVWNNRLINTGYFNLAGGTDARCIAAWDGSTWEPLGGGLNHEALGLAGYKGSLYAAGYFDSAGSVEAKYIAKWDGISWQSVGGGFDNIVNTLIEFDGKLIAGGWFTTAGGSVITPSVAMWDGNEWSPMSSGMNGPVYTFCIYRGELYAAGDFTTASSIPAGGIAKWDGYKWQSAGTGVLGGEKAIYTLEVYNDELYAGGSFIKMDEIFCYNIAKYNGISWRAAGSGADGALCNASRGYISSLKVCNNELYAAGHFSRINGVIANKLARFNGINWCSVEYGVDLRPRALEVFNNDLIINGDFYSASGVDCNNIVKYTPVRNLTGIQNNNIPQNFKLEQNYPNPFNPETKISFSITENSRVTLKVFDITGKEIAVILNKDISAGNYTENFNADKFASGVYIYRIEAASKDGVIKSESKKMVLIK